jgi:phospholipid transport system substrate-binding protein
LSARFANYNGESIRITGSRSESEHSTVVSTTIVHPDGTLQSNVDWRVQDTPVGLKIADVSVAGVSMAMTFREQIAALIDQDGGQVAPAISRLREKIDTATRDAISGNSPTKASTSRPR